MNQQQEVFLERVQEIDAYDFEALVADLWTKQGWETYVTSGAKDNGVDVIAEQSTPYPQKQAIQVKRYNPDNSVGRPDIQQYASIRQERTDVDSVIVVTTGTFTDEAQAAARNLNVKLIDGSRLYNLIDALESFDLVEEYLRPGTDQKALVSEADDAKAPQSDSTKAPSDVGGDGETVSDVPRAIPDLLSVRQELTDKLNQLESKLENAVGAIEEDDYYTAVDYYQKAGVLRAQCQQGIARYDAGLTSIDGRTAEHLPPTETFLGRFEQLDARLRENSPTAVHNAERIQALEQLVSELEDHEDAIREYLSSGDQELNQEGSTFESAASWYQKAADALVQLRETEEIYEALVTEYDSVIVENHSGLSQKISVTDLESEIDQRLDSQSAYEDLEAISEEAIGSFKASLLTRNDGELFEKELFEYVPGGETLQFVFEPPRRGFQIASPSGTFEPFHDNPLVAGSSFLLLTDQRAMYVSGVGDHDETVSISFEDVNDVTATVNASTKSLSITVAGGKIYKFDGLRNRSSDIEPAANYVDTRIE